jgi:DNA-binding transcriptional regulator YdaS (Cro superfamily)
MNTSPHPLDQAALILGGRAVLADLLKVTAAAVGNWKARGVPIERCPEIERLTGGRVLRQQLRPEDWPRIWPELDTASANEERSPDTTTQQPAGQKVPHA